MYEIDALIEEHVPMCKVNGDKIIVKVGEYEHSSTEQHYIMWIALISDGNVYKKDLQPTDKPVAELDKVNSGKVYAYCNLNGLWEGTI